MSGGEALPYDGLADRLSAVRERISRAGGDAESIRVVAMTKGFGPDAVAAAVAVGIDDVGENYADELVSKQSAVGVPGGCRWHFLGRVQRNKVRHLASRVAMWQTVDRAAAGLEIATRVPGAPVLVQVNVTGEPGRNGCSIEEAPALVEGLSDMGLSVRGLMAVGPRPDGSDGHEAARGVYRRTAQLSRRLGLPECSMGMTDDLEVAVQEGATMVRVGRALFGPRSVPDHLRR